MYARTGSITIFYVHMYINRAYGYNAGSTHTRDARVMTGTKRNVLRVNAGDVHASLSEMYRHADKGGEVRINNSRYDDRLFVMVAVDKVPDKKTNNPDLFAWTPGLVTTAKTQLIDVSND